MEKINEISPEELESQLKEGIDIEVVDVREDEEVAQGMIKNAKHIPLQEIPDAINSLDKSKHHVLVCRSGRRSMRAAEFLSENGYNVSNMTGGMLEWKGAVTK
ncbi:MAG: rhodanese-like domain-containing protein [Bacillota bacterium]|uniref:Rhodanese-like domain-containing protein n=1 Tax=Virgibacillus salarius TaxID=447199 RepID=A0A941E013_9BACI|nr:MULTISPECIES: rhodanese-like domain-containing protein [Bacillaceae]NAZ10902.1 rhodanese-like domain-containing protein [Agaribacter marinus]MBR7798194.1 rhodanese-like domain-containing protein [Virgibacillus salarius]MCC2249431.1 rhodanese-like domain-containing protein [Virgibacillus sp. AGTR]MDY7043371.1 rhodanese-like domain-containing protein [Virgibacillus sp. M23]QRZ17800.1 rhodanese-like domain-containing protein [Virgibacillus sp. AGTR]